jgi:hypothetical protein
MEPIAPKRLVPPMTEEAMACSSHPSAEVAFPIPIRAASKMPTKAAQNAEHVGDVDHPSRIDARKPSSLHIRANCEDVATEPAVVKKNVGWERHDDNHPEKIRKDQKTSSRKAGEIIVGNGNRRAIRHEQADAAQGRERGQKAVNRAC